MPPLLGMTDESLVMAFLASSNNVSRSGPVIFRSITCEPPNPRPKIEVCLAKPNVPGSEKIVLRSIGTSSFARVLSVADVPMKVEVDRDIYQKRAIFTGPLSHSSNLTRGHSVEIFNRLKIEGHSFGFSPGSAQ